MTWSINQRSHDPWREDAAIRPDKVLYSYDGPTIFTASFGFFEALFIKVEEMDYTDLYLVSSTTQEIVDAILKGRLSVRGGFATGQYWIVELRKNFAVFKYWTCSKDELPEDFLPNKNLALFAHLGRAPDTLMQSSAFFSMAFQGEKMKKAGMPFSRFKGLVDAAHDASRKVLTPLYLSRTRTKTFDYSLQEPSFSSLVLSIRRPIINEAAAIRRMPPDYSSGLNSVQEHFSEQRDVFLEEVSEVVKEADAGGVTDSLVQERYFLLEAIQALIPNEENDLSSVDFTGAGETNVRTVGIGSRSGNRITRAFRKADGMSKEISGRIEIINSASNYFVLLTPGNRQINCSLDPASYKRLEKNHLFRNGSFISVKGDLYRRPRRDWLRVEGEPRLQEDVN